MTTTMRSHSQEAVLAALVATPGLTAAEVAGAAGVGRSTATRALADLEQEGLARRQPSAPVEGRRAAARWSTTEAGGTGTVGEAEPPADVACGTAESRLGRGELAAMIAGYVAARPNVELSPRQIATALGGRSPGAVGNALSRLVIDGTVEVVAEHPLRYRAVADPVTGS